MCLAVPARVAEILENDLVRCRVGESDTFVTASTLLLEEAARVDDYLIVHAGFALRKLDVADAEATLELMREMAAAAEETFL